MGEMSLPKPAAEWIAAQVAAGRYPDAEAYLVELIERDRLASLNAAIDAGLSSGTSSRSVDEIFEAARQRWRHAAG